jgi:hypothetical protein
MNDDGTSTATGTVDGNSGASAAGGTTQPNGAPQAQTPADAANTNPVESLLGVQAETNPEGTQQDGAGAGVKEQEGKAEENPEDKSGESNPVTLEDLNIPEGKQWDEELGKSFLDIINDTSIPRSGLSQKLLDLYSTEQDKLFEGQRAAEKAQRAADEAFINQLRAEGLEQCKKDPEIGGQKWEESKALIKKGSAFLFSPSLAKQLEILGLDTHPDVVKACIKAARMAGEDPAPRSYLDATPKEDGIVAMHRKILKGE